MSSSLCKQMWPVENRISSKGTSGWEGSVEMVSSEEDGGQAAEWEPARVAPVCFHYALSEPFPVICASPRLQGALHQFGAIVVKILKID